MLAKVAALKLFQRLPFSSLLFDDFIEGVCLLELGSGSFFVFNRFLEKMERINFFNMIFRILFLEL
jgi:hypothetical protein